MKKGFIIAMDGPVASGKGTIAKSLVEKFDGFNLYSGSVFRCLGLLCLQKGMSVTDEESVGKAIEDATIELRDNKVFLNSIDVTERIQHEDIAKASSSVAVFRNAREKMNDLMRGIAQQKIEEGIIVITEGRDMGTTVFPQAEVKLFLTAKPEIRAKRRLLQTQERHDNGQTLESVLQETILRDKQDTEREISPLTSQPEKYDYTIIDDSNLTEEQTFEKILTIIKQKQSYDRH